MSTFTSLNSILTGSFPCSFDDSFHDNVGCSPCFFDDSLDEDELLINSDSEIFNLIDEYQELLITQENGEHPLNAENLYQAQENAVTKETIKSMLTETIIDAINSQNEEVAEELANENESSKSSPRKSDSPTFLNENEVLTQHQNSKETIAEPTLADNTNLVNTIEETVARLKTKKRELEEKFRHEVEKHNHIELKMRILTEKSNKFEKRMDANYGNLKRMNIMADRLYQEICLLLQQIKEKQNVYRKSEQTLHLELTELHPKQRAMKLNEYRIIAVRNLRFLGEVVQRNIKRLTREIEKEKALIQTTVNLLNPIE